MLNVKRREIWFFGKMNSQKVNRFSGKKILVLFLIMTAYLFGQSWNNTVTTSINEPNAVKMDLFTNKDGNHLVVQNSNASNSIRYYLLNSSGSIVRSATIETSGGAEFPYISGDKDKVYVVYKLGSNLKLKKSINAGQSWTTLDDMGVGNNICNGVDIVYDYRGLHVVYAMQDNGNDYETYYYRINSNDQWVDYKIVTDYDANEVGGFPSVAVSDNRIHIGYNTGTESDPFWNLYEDAKSRDKYNTTWQTPQQVNSIGKETSARDKVQVRTDKLYVFFYDLLCDLGICGYDLKVKSRDLDGTAWSSSTKLNSVNNPAQFMGAEQTANSELHVVYGDWEIYHRYYNGTIWSPEYFLNFIQPGVTFGFSYTSNDLYCVWEERFTNEIKYAQYDAAPLAPQNLTVTQSIDDHPELSWDANTEPDLDKYFIYKYINDWVLIGSTTNTVYEDTDETYCTAQPPAECTGTRQVTYRVTAVDIQSHESDYSNAVVVVVIGYASKIGIDNPGAGKIIEYSLDQNYPNPFNPSTQISYSLANDADVTVKIYDVLGTEVANLVDESQAAGSYDISFNANNLSSGVYIYRITAFNNERILFTDAKRMLLMK